MRKEAEEKMKQPAAAACQAPAEAPAAAAQDGQKSDQLAREIRNALRKPPTSGYADQTKGPADKNEGQAPEDDDHGDEEMPESLKQRNPRSKSATRGMDEDVCCHGHLSSPRCIPCAGMCQICSLVVGWAWTVQ